MASRISLTSEQKSAIARVAISSAQLDNIIDRITYLWLEQPDSITAFLLKSLNAERLIELLKLMYWERLPDHHRYIEAVFDRVKEYRTERNHILHWLHETADEEGSLQFMDKRAFRTTPPKVKSVSDIDAIADGLDNCFHELQQWMIFGDWYDEVTRNGDPKALINPPSRFLPAILRA